MWLTYEQHEGTYGVHGRYGHELDLKLMRLGQAFFELTHSREEFISIFGKNYFD